MIRSAPSVGVIWPSRSWDSTSDCASRTLSSEAKRCSNVSWTIDHIHLTCWSERFRSNMPAWTIASRCSSMAAQNFSMPSFSSADMVSTGGVQIASLARTIFIAVARSRAARLAGRRFAPSALLMEMTSAISSTPFLMPCS